MPRIEASHTTNIKVNRNTSEPASLFTIETSKSGNKVIISINDPKAVKSKQFLFTVSDNLALGKVVLVDCGEFYEQDSLELFNLRNGLWSPNEYNLDPTRETILELLPDGEYINTRTDTSFASRIWNTSFGSVGGGELEFASRINIYKSQTQEPHLFIEMKKLDVAQIDESPTYDDNSEGGLLEAEGDPSFVLPGEIKEHDAVTTYFLDDPLKLTKDYFVDKILGYTSEGFQVILQLGNVSEINSASSLEIIEYFEEAENAYISKEVQITYGSLDSDEMKQLLTTLIDELLKKDKTISVKRKDRLFGIQELDTITIAKYSSNNKIKITVTDLGDSDYESAFYPLIYMLVSQGKMITLEFATGHFDSTNNWKIATLINQLEDEMGISINFVEGKKREDSTPVYVLMPKNRAQKS